MKKKHKNTSKFTFFMSFSIVKVCWVSSASNVAKRAWQTHSEASDKSAIFSIATFDATNAVAQHFSFDGNAWVAGEQEPLAPSQTRYIMDANIHTVKNILSPSSHANQVIWVVNVHSSKFILATLATAPDEIRVIRVSRTADAHTPFTLATTATGSAVAPGPVVQEDLLFTLAFDVADPPTPAQLAFATRQLGTFVTLSDAPVRAQRPTTSHTRTNDPPLPPPPPPGVSNNWFDGLGTDAEQTKLFVVGTTYELKVTRDGLTKTRTGVAIAVDTIEVTDIGGRKVSLILPPKDGSICHWSPVDETSGGAKTFALGLSHSAAGIQPTVIESWVPFLDAVQSLEILKSVLHEHFETKGSAFRHTAVEKIIQWGRDESSRGLSDPAAYRRLKKELYDLTISFGAYKHKVAADELRLACDQKLGISDDFVMSVASHLAGRGRGRGRGGPNDGGRGNGRGGTGRGGYAGNSNGAPFNNKQCAHCGSLGHHKIECRGLAAGRPARTPITPVPGKTVA